MGLSIGKDWEGSQFPKLGQHTQQLAKLPPQLSDVTPTLVTVSERDHQMLVRKTVLAPVDRLFQRQYY